VRTLNTAVVRLAHAHENGAQMYQGECQSDSIASMKRHDHCIIDRVIYTAGSMRAGGVNTRRKQLPPPATRTYSNAA
jgi:hypothetical protein